MSIQKSDITLDVNGKPIKAYLASPAQSAAGAPGILLLPSWWGLKPFFKQVCDQLAGLGYTALAPDYYDGQVARTIDEAKALQQVAEGDPKAMSALIKAAKDHLTSLRPGKPIAILGYSMGTDWAVLTASKEADVAALVLFYGFYNVDLSRTKPKVLGHFAEKDEWQPLDGVKKFEHDLKAAGLDASINIYPGAAHWFMEDDRPEYDPKAAQLAWDRTVKFLKKNIA